MTQEFLINEAIKIAAELAERTTMKNDHELMKIAVDLQRNYLYAQANVMSEKVDHYPVALEAIAMSLGYTNRGFEEGYLDNKEMTITGYLEEIKHSIEAIADKLPDDSDQY